MVQLNLTSLLHCFVWRFPDGVSAEEKFGLSVDRLVPLEVVAEPKLPPHLYAEP
jgi:typhasterol/6-deoxotyphasterol 2alpha-hydroxylase